MEKKLPMLLNGEVRITSPGTHGGVATFQFHNFPVSELAAGGAVELALELTQVALDRAKAETEKKGGE